MAQEIVADGLDSVFHEPEKVSGDLMEDGRKPVSKNQREANIKPFSTARWAWMCSGT